MSMIITMMVYDGDCDSEVWNLHFTFAMGKVLSIRSVNNGSSEKAATMPSLHHWHGSKAILYSSASGRIKIKTATRQKEKTSSLVGDNLA